MSCDDIQAVDLRQCWDGGRQHKFMANRELRTRPEMLSQRIRYVVAGLLLGLMLLLASGPAVAHRLHHDAHATAAQGKVVRVVTPTPDLIRPKAMPVEAAYAESTSHGGSGPNTSLRCPLPEASGPQTVASSGVLSVKSCEHAGGCSCCGAHAGCCGMSCCAVGLPASPPALPNADARALATAASELFHETNLGTLLRPPRPLV